MEYKYCTCKYCNVQKETVGSCLVWNNRNLAVWKIKVRVKFNLQKMKWTKM